MVRRAFARRCTVEVGCCRNWRLSLYTKAPPARWRLADNGGRWATAGAAIVPSSLEASLLSAAKPARAINGGGGGGGCGAGRRQCEASGSGGAAAMRGGGDIGVQQVHATPAGIRGDRFHLLPFAHFSLAHSFLLPQYFYFFSCCLFSFLELQILYTYFWILGSNKHLQHFRPKDMASCLINGVTFSNRGPRGLCFIISYYYYWFHRICAEYKECMYWALLIWVKTKLMFHLSEICKIHTLNEVKDFINLVFICCYFTSKVVKVAKSQKVFHFGSNLQKISSKLRPWASAL